MPAHIEKGVSQLDHIRAALELCAELVYPVGTVLKHKRKSTSVCMVTSHKQNDGLLYYFLRPLFIPDSYICSRMCRHSYVQQVYDVMHVPEDCMDLSKWKRSKSVH